MIAQTYACVPLELAVLCCSCNFVSNSPGDTCVRCSARGGLMNLSTILDKQENLHVVDLAPAEC